MFRTNVLWCRGDFNVKTSCEAYALTFPDMTLAGTRERCEIGLFRSGGGGRRLRRTDRGGGQLCTVGNPPAVHLKIGENCSIKRGYFYHQFHLLQEDLAPGLLPLAGVLRVRKADLAHRLDSFAGFNVWRHDQWTCSDLP